ncbi:hypothetical protein MBLNU459_g7704t3 [Dothideomycetes sp. NU459]
MAETEKQNKTSPVKNSPGGSSNSAAVALGRLNESLRDCLKYEKYINDAAKNAEKLFHLGSENEKLRSEISECEGSVSRLVKVHTVDVFELTKERDKLVEANKVLEKDTKDLNLRNKQLLDKKKNNEEQLVKINGQLEKQAKENATAKKSLQQREKDVANLEKIILQENEKSSRLMKEHDAALQKNEDFGAKLQNLQQQLQEWERYRSGLEVTDLDSMTEKIHALSHHVHGLVGKYFKTELPPRFLENQRATQLMETLRSWPALESVSFIPESDSDTAKNFRMAVAFAVLTKYLMEDIFRPTFIGRDDAIHESLVEQAEMDSKKESLCRALLLSLSDLDSDRFDDGEQLFVQHAEQVLRDMVPISRMEAFNSELRALAAKAVALWHEIQHGTTRIEASVNETGYNGWNRLPLTANVQSPVGSSNTQQKNDSSDVIAFVLFPMFFEVTGSNIFKVFYNGLAVSELQKAAAEQEWRETSRAMNRTVSKRLGHQRRTRRTSEVNGGGSFLEQP